VTTGAAVTEAHIVADEQSEMAANGAKRPTASRINGDNGSMLIGF
jgi:hypothetical protein